MRLPPKPQAAIDYSVPDLLAALAWHGLRGLYTVAQPGPITFSIVRETNMADQLGVTLVLPPKSAPDVSNRELTVTMAGGSPQIIPLTADVNTHEIIVDEGVAVTVALVDIDNAGNRSPDSTLNFTATDTVPPPAPGGVNVTSVREIFPTP